MATVIDATVGGASSNSYVTLVRANALMDQLPHADEWLSDFTIANSKKHQLLIHATRLIDRQFEFYGAKASDAQALEWPRVHIQNYLTGVTISSSIIPDFIEWATVEWAFALHLDAEGDVNIAPGLTRLRTPSYEAEFGGSGKRRMPEVIDWLLSPYGARSRRDMIRLMRA